MDDVKNPSDRSQSPPREQNHGSPMPETTYVTTESMQSHFERLETRMGRIESALNEILGLLRLSAVDDEDGRQRTKSNSSASDHYETDTALDTTNSRKTQQQGQETPVEQDTNRQYIYTPLDSTKSQIRLLKLNRAEELSDPLVADLVIVSLDDISEAGRSRTIDVRKYGYTALSYTWGPPVFDGSVLLDGCKFPITKNLEAALSLLRFAHRDDFELPIRDVVTGSVYYYWIDQICK
jgi:hypothetical protein